MTGSQENTLEKVDPKKQTHQNKIMKFIYYLFSTSQKKNLGEKTPENKNMFLHLICFSSFNMCFFGSVDKNLGENSIKKQKKS